MNEVEYVLRIVLKARDELAAGLAAARRELKNFVKDLDGDTKKINAFNQSLKDMDTNVQNVTQKFKEWRAVIQGTDKDSDAAGKSMASLNKELEQTTKKAGAASKQQAELIQLSRRLNKEAKELAKTEHESARDKDFQIKQLKEFGKQLDTLSTKMTGAGNKRLAFDWSRNATEAADRIVAEEKRKVAAVEQAEKDKQKALEDTNKFWLKMENAAFKQHQKNLEAEAKLEKDAAAQRIKLLEAEQQRKEYLRKRDADAYQTYARSRAAQARLGGGDATSVDIAEARRTVAVLREIAGRYDDSTKSARNLRGESERLNNALSDYQKTSRNAAAATARETAEFQKSIDAKRDAENAMRRLRAIQARQEGGPLGDFDAAEARDVVQHLRQAANGFGRTSREARNLRGEAESLNASLRRSGRETEHNSHLFRQFANIITENKESVATLDNQLRGIGWLAAFAFAQELITVLGGLGGAFIAVASSAAQAAVAIGGTFVAGIAQAMPAIGLLGAALSRVGGVMDAVKQAQNAQKAEAVQGAGAARRVADATDTVRNAQDGLANAQRAVKDAQKDLTDARKDAREELDDLARAEKAADLAARGAVLSQKEAQEALRLAIASGDVEGIARAELGVLEAQADAEDKLAAAQKARRDAAKGERGGVEGTEGVQDAKRALEDAERSAARAGRGIETAKRNATEAAEGTQTAAANLNYLLSQLSPAERRLYTALTNIQEAYKKTYRPITDLIIDSFTRSVKGVQRIMLMPEVIQMATKTAQQISRQLNRIFDAFTTDDMIKQFLRIAEEGRKNLAPLATIAIRIGKAFFNIAETAGPAFRRLLRFVSNLVGQFLDLTEQKGKMTDFFNTGEKHFEAWIKLGLAVIRLFMALGGAGGAETGVQLVKDATKAIDDLIQKINDNKDAVKDFFGDSREIVHEVVGVIVALAEELHKAFTPENVHRFAELLKTVVIPAFGTALEWISKITTEVLKFTSTDFGRKVATFTIAFFFFSKVLGSTFGLLLDFGRFLGVFGRAFAVVGQAIGKVFPALGRIATLLRVIGPQMARVALGAAAPWLLVAGAVVFLLAKLGLLDDLWEELKEAANALWGQLEPPLKRLVDSFKNLFAAISEGKGPLGALLDILRPVLKILIEVGGFLLEGIAKAIGQVLGGIIDILGGLINVLAGILSGDLGMIWDGIKQMLLGLGNIIIGAIQLLLFRGLGGVLRGAGSLIVRGVKAFGRGIWDIIKGFPRMFWEVSKDIVSFFWRGFRGLGRIIRNVVGDAWNWLRHFPGRFWELAKDIVSRFWRGYQRMGRVMRGAIDDAWQWIKRLPGRFWELAKDIVSFFWRGYRAIGRRLRSAIEDAWGWIKGFPKRFEDLAKDAVKLFVNAFKGLGKSIINVLSEGLSGAGNFAKRLINGIFKLIEDGWNKGVGGKKVLGVSLPDIKIPRLAAGGPIPGSGKGDRYPALLEAGEHVWTAAEVRRAGGHEAMFAMRRFFGGGGQGRGGRYAEGGAGAGGGNLSISFQGGNLDDFASQWRVFWNVLVITARRSTILINKLFRDMRVETARSADRMYRDVRSSMDDIENSFSIRGKRIVKSWTSTWKSLKKVAYDGLNYVAHETNKALKGMGEKTINFGLSEPKADDGKAGGGWIGGKGQRGRDRGFYALGAGEAVLNWQHQRYVEPALNAFYGHGMSEMFNRTRGYHAGGPEQPGFARGRLPDTLGAKPGFAVFMQLFRQLAGKDVYVMSGSRPGSITTSGNVSNHSAGNAVDISNIISQGGSPSNPPPRNALDNLHKWISSHIPAPPRLDFLWRTTTGGNHYNHIHLGLNPAVTATIAAARNYIKKNLGEKFGSLVGALDPIKKRFVTPKNLTLSKLVQKSLDKVLKAANKMIEETFPDADAGGKTGDYSGGVISAAKFGGIVKQALNILNIKSSITDWVRTMTRQAMHESTLNPQARNDTAAGQAAGGPKGILQVVDGTFAAYKEPGHGDVFNPLDNTLASIKYVIARYGNGNPDAAVNALWARGGGAYARGGEIPGGEGMPVPILAHAREWILNPKQQARLTQLLGMPRNLIKNVLGFPARSGQAFQAGGEVEAGAEDEAKLNIGVTTKSMRDRLRRLRRGLYELPVLPIQSWEMALREARRAFIAIRNRGKAFSVEVADINKEIKELEKGDETKAEKEKIKKLKAERKALIASGTMVKEVEKVNKEIAELQKGDEDRAQLRQISKLRRERRQLQRRGRREVSAQARLQALQALVREGGLIETLDAARERFTARIARALTFATFRFNRASGRVRRRMDDVEVATKELENTRREMRKILGEEGVITKALKKTNARIRALRRGGITEAEAPELRELVTMQVRLREQRVNIRDLHAQQLQRIYEAQVARQQAVVDEINSRAERDIGAQDIQRRMGEAIGSESMIDAANASVRAIQQRQMTELQARVAAASRIGNTEMVNTLNDQIADLRTTIFESIQQELRDAADRINARAQRRLGRLDLGGRMLDAVGAVGLGSVASVAGEQFSRGGLFAQRGQALQQQRGELQALVGRAGAAGNIQLVQDLTDQLAELDVTIQENTKAYFDARVEDVNSRAGFSLNVNDLMKQIAELEGTAAGQIDQQRIANLLTERGNILVGQRMELEALLIEAQREGNQQAVNDLTLALLENRVAILQNTEAVEEANGLTKDPQSFTSSAWTRFREAIFSGMGQVLPQYDPGNLMGGVNTGAVIYPAVTNSTSTGGDTNITLNEVGRPVDLTEVSSVVTFASKTAQ